MVLSLTLALLSSIFCQKANIDFIPILFYFILFYEVLMSNDTIIIIIIIFIIFIVSIATKLLKHEVNFLTETSKC